MLTLTDHFTRLLVPVDFSETADETEDGEAAAVIGNTSIHFSPASRRAVAIAAAIARSSDAKLRLIHATPRMNYDSMYTGPARAALPAKLVEEINANARATSERTFEADLIIMAASGRSRVTRFFVGSTADRVIRQAKCPVLVIPASGAN